MVVVIENKDPLAVFEPQTLASQDVSVDPNSAVNAECAAAPVAEHDPIHVYVQNRVTAVVTRALASWPLLLREYDGGSVERTTLEMSFEVMRREIADDLGWQATRFLSLRQLRHTYWVERERILEYREEQLDPAKVPVAALVRRALTDAVSQEVMGALRSPENPPHLRFRVRDALQRGLRRTYRALGAEQIARGDSPALRAEFTEFQAEIARRLDPESAKKISYENFAQALRVHANVTQMLRLGETVHLNLRDNPYAIEPLRRLSTTRMVDAVIGPKEPAEITSSENIELYSRRALRAVLEHGNHHAQLFKHILRPTPQASVRDTESDKPDPAIEAHESALEAEVRRLEQLASEAFGRRVTIDVDAIRAAREFAFRPPTKVMSSNAARHRSRHIVLDALLTQLAPDLPRFARRVRAQPKVVAVQPQSAAARSDLPPWAREPEVRVRLVEAVNSLIEGSRDMRKNVFDVRNEFCARVASALPENVPSGEAAFTLIATQAHLRWAGILGVDPADQRAQLAAGVIRQHESWRFVLETVGYRKRAVFVPLPRYPPRDLPLEPVPLPEERVASPRTQPALTRAPQMRAPTQTQPPSRPQTNASEAPARHVQNFFILPDEDFVTRLTLQSTIRRANLDAARERQVSASRSVQEFDREDARARQTVESPAQPPANAPTAPAVQLVERFDANLPLWARNRALRETIVTLVNTHLVPNATGTNAQRRDARARFCTELRLATANVDTPIAVAVDLIAADAERKWAAILGVKDPAHPAITLAVNAARSDREMRTSLSALNLAVGVPEANIARLPAEVLPIPLPKPNLVARPNIAAVAAVAPARPPPPAPESQIDPQLQSALKRAAQSAIETPATDAPDRDGQVGRHFMTALDVIAQQHNIAAEALIEGLVRLFNGQGDPTLEARGIDIDRLGIREVVHALAQVQQLIPYKDPGLAITLVELVQLLGDEMALENVRPTYQDLFSDAVQADVVRAVREFASAIAANPAAEAQAAETLLRRLAEIERKRNLREGELREAAFRRTPTEFAIMLNLPPARFAQLERALRAAQQCPAGRLFARTRGLPNPRASTAQVEGREDPERRNDQRERERASPHRFRDTDSPPPNGRFRPGRRGGR